MISSFTRPGEAGYLAEMVIMDNPIYPINQYCLQPFLARRLLAMRWVGQINCL